MTRKRLPKPTYLITCDQEWEHCAEVEGKKEARAWMIAHSRGERVSPDDDEAWANCRSSTFRVWELFGAAKVHVEAQVDLLCIPTEDDD
jgi:hypothetical protein